MAFVRFCHLILFTLVALVAAPSTLQAQSKSKKTIPDSWMDNFEWRSIGPANMSGRITSIAVYENDPRIWYVATASGGLLKTVNNGVDFEHQFDDQATVSIGDVQVSQKDPNIVWVGTGEANPRNSVSWGDGVYKSTDGGKTWKNMGLKESFQIGRIAVHPKDPDVVYVGALGRLWGPNEERGLFKTTDGGKTWKNILYIDDMTGVIDIKMHPKDPDTLLVATYERQRDGFDGNDPEKKYGEGSGLYRTTNGGKTFKKVTKGIPTCKLGRIGLDWYRKDPKYVYAIIESEKIAKMPPNRGYAGIRGEDADVGARLTDVTDDGPAEKAGLKSGDIVLQIEDDMVMSYQGMLKQLRMKKAGDELKMLIIRDRKQQNVTMKLGKQPESNRRRSDFTGTLGGQAANLQGQQGGENEEEYGGVYESKDGGVSWKRINTLNPRPMYYSQFRVDPSDRKNMYVLGTSLYRSTDGGETFNSDGGRGIHPDNHALWIDPKMGDHMVLGNDGGIHVTWDRMDNWDHLNHVAIGQFYHVGLDATRDYKVYGGLQDNGSWGGPAQSRSGGIVNTDWFRVGGGDGFITLVDPNDPDQIYYESQNGAMGRIHLKTGERGFFRPRPPRGSSARRTGYRFNWKTPFILSPHNPAIHYSAGNHVFRSYWKGDGMKAISPDITNTSRGAGSAISESPVTPGVIYVGTTDGAVWMTRDSGENWTEIFVKKEEKKEDDEDKEEDEKSESDEKSETNSAASDDKAKSKKGGDAKRRRKGAAGETSRERSERRSRRNRKSAKGSDRKGSDKKSADDSKGKKSKSAKSKSEKSKSRKSSGAKGRSDDAGIKAVMDRLQGSWKGELLVDRLPEDQRGIELNLRTDDGKLTGNFKTPRNDTQLSDFEINAAKGTMTFKGKNDQREFDFDCELKSTDDGDVIEGEVDMGRFKVQFKAKKVDGNVSTSYSTVSFTNVPQEDADETDALTGVWAAEMQSEEIPEGQGEFQIELRLKEKGKVVGLVSSPMGDMEISDGKFNSESGKLTMSISSGDGSIDADVTATVKGSAMSGMISANGGQFEVEFSANRESTELPEEEGASAEEPQPEPEADKPAKKAKAKKAAKAKPAAKKAGAVKKQEASPSDAKAEDVVSGKWEGRFISERFGGGNQSNITLMLKLEDKGKVTGMIETSRSDLEITSGKFDAKTNKLMIEGGDNFTLSFDTKITGNEMKGEVDFAGRQTIDFEAKRVVAEASPVAEASSDAKTATATKGALGDLVPGPRWVSSIEASKHSAGRVYLTMDGHRSNDDEPYVFKSEDYGKTWTSIRANLPTSAGSTRVLREDIENPDLLFLGCEFSAWVSVDRGESWTRFKGLPTVAVHEIAIHPTSGEIVAGTHGRSLWVADISGLRQMSTDALSKDVSLFKPNSVVNWRRQNERGSSGTRRFVGENPNRTAEIFYYIGTRVRDVTLEIHDNRGNVVRKLEAKSDVGLHRVDWDLRREPTTRGNQQQRRGGGRRFGGRTVPTGDYVVVLTAGGQTYKELVSIEADPEMNSAVTSDEEFEMMKLLSGEVDEESEQPVREQDQ